MKIGHIDYETPEVQRLAEYLRDRISPESPSRHFLAMATECWNYIKGGGMYE